MPSEEVEIRKQDHIRICLERDVESQESSGFNETALVHDSLPELALTEIDISTELLGKKIKAPIVIEPITGGTEESVSINRNLAEIAEELGIVLSIGSQRAALEDSRLERTYRVVRDTAPSTVILANIGCAQLLRRDPLEIAEAVVEMIDADGLTVHLNPLQESIQPEGDTDLQGVLNQIGRLTSNLKVPIIVKETGAGISKETALKLEHHGVEMVDTAGLGGTTWAGVEHYRSLAKGDHVRARLGKRFWDWGIPTVVSLVEILEFTSMKVIASGGVRSGLDVAKAMALGAEASGLALPLLKAAVKSKEAISERLDIVIQELRLALFLTGSGDLASLKCKPLILMGKTADRLLKRGVDVSRYARRHLK